MVSTVRLAAVHYETGFRIDDFLKSLGDLLRADDVRLGGALQLNAPEAETACSAMTLVDLASGARMGISQELGKLAKGCRLDTGLLAEFGTLLDRDSGESADLLIFNKFGKAECEGHGLRSNLVHAIETGIPVLTAVRPPHLEAWQDFHAGLADALAPDLQRVRSWCLEAVQTRREAARCATPA